MEERLSMVERQVASGGWSREVSLFWNSLEHFPKAVVLDNVDRLIRLIRRSAEVIPLSDYVSIVGRLHRRLATEGPHFTEPIFELIKDPSLPCPPSLRLKIVQGFAGTKFVENERYGFLLQCMTALGERGPVSQREWDESFTLQLRNPLKCLEWLQVMEAHGCRIQRWHYEAQMEKWLAQGSHSRVRRILLVMRKYNVSLSADMKRQLFATEDARTLAVVQKLLSSSSKSKDGGWMAETRTLLGETWPSSLGEWHSRLFKLCSMGLLSSAFNVLRLLVEERKHEPDTRCFSIVLAHLAQQGQLEDCILLLDSLKALSRSLHGRAPQRFQLQHWAGTDPASSRVHASVRNAACVPNTTTFRVVVEAVAGGLKKPNKVAPFSTERERFFEAQLLTDEQRAWMKAFIADALPEEHRLPRVQADADETARAAVVLRLLEEMECPSYHPAAFHLPDLPTLQAAHCGVKTAQDRATVHKAWARSGGVGTLERPLPD